MMKKDQKSKVQGPNLGRMLLVTLALVSLGALAAVGVLYYGQRSASAEPTIPIGVSLTSWFDNGKGGEHVLQLAQGNPPPVGVRLAGVVKSDTDCEPDPQGLNHCHNVIALSNGSSIEVINNHTMHRYPCLSPGQRLSVMRLNENWVVAYEPRGARFN